MRSAAPGLLAAVRVLRAEQWAHFAGLPLAGLDRESLSAPGGLWRGALGIAAAALALGHAYGINAWADRAVDLSSRKNPLAGIARVPGEVALVVASAAVGALALGLLLGTTALLLVSCSLAAGTLYSVGPRFKAWPVAGLLFNTAIFAPLLGLAASWSAPPPALALLGVTFVGLILQSQLLHEGADVGEDAAGGVLTTARWLGPRVARGVVVGLALPFGLSCQLLAPWPWLGWAAAGLLAAGAAVALLEARFAEARLLHRRLSAAGGALLFAAGLFS